MNVQIFRELCNADQIVAVYLAIIYMFALAYMDFVSVCGLFFGTWSEPKNAHIGFACGNILWFAFNENVLFNISFSATEYKRVHSTVSVWHERERLLAPDIQWHGMRPSVLYYSVNQRQRKMLNSSCLWRFVVVVIVILCWLTFSLPLTTKQNFHQFKCETFLAIQNCTDKHRLIDNAKYLPHNFFRFLSRQNL